MSNLKFGMPLRCRLSSSPRCACNRCCLSLRAGWLAGPRASVSVIPEFKTRTSAAIDRPTDSLLEKAGVVVLTAPTVGIKGRGFERLPLAFTQCQCSSHWQARTGGRWLDRRLEMRDPIQTGYKLRPAFWLPAFGHHQNSHQRCRGLLSPLLRMILWD
jgi:hypothetical protein